MKQDTNKQNKTKGLNRYDSILQWLRMEKWCIDHRLTHIHPIASRDAIASKTICVSKYI